LFDQGADVEHVVFLESGLAKLVVVGADGQETIVALRHARSWLGIEAAILGATHGFGASAVLPSTVRAIPLAALHDELARRTEIGRAISRQLCEDMVAMTEACASAATSSAKERLARLLTELHRAQGGEGVATREARTLRLPIRQWELAQLLGVTPAYLCHLLARLEEEGRIRRTRAGELVVP
jgi:CRP/FNR family transcriptional regulator